MSCNDLSYVSTDHNIGNATLTSVQNEVEYDWIFWYCLCCGCISCVLNTLVLFIALTHIKFDEKPNQVLVVCMTVGDLVMGVAMVSTGPFISCIQTWACAPYFSCIWLGQASSTVFLLWLNVDKMIRITRPLNYRILVSKSKTIKLSIATWVILASVSVYSYSGLLSISEYTPRCVDLKLEPPLLFALIMLGGFAIPNSLSLVCSVIIFILARRARNSLIRQAANKNRRPKLQKGLSTTSVTSQHYKNSRQFLSRILFVFSSTLWTSVTAMPYRIGYLVMLFCVSSMPAMKLIPSTSQVFNQSRNFINNSLNATGAQLDLNFTSTTGNEYNCGKGDYYEWMSDWFLCLCVLGSIGNPLITLITQSIYSNRLSYICQWLFCRQSLRNRQKELEWSRSRSRTHSRASDAQVQLLSVKNVDAMLEEHKVVTLPNGDVLL